MKKYQLSKSDISEILGILRWPDTIMVSKIKRLLLVECKEKKLLVGDEFNAVMIENEEKVILPFLADERLLEAFPSVRIDMGAIKAICNGASLMRPGISSMDEFKQGDIVTIRDNTHGKYLAVGIALVDSKEAEAMKKGQVIKNLHHIGDECWEAYKNL